MLVVCDIDGTLADIERRVKNAGMRPPRWMTRAFQMWLDKLQKPEEMLADPLIVEVRDCIVALSKVHKLVYLTGRSNSYRKVTRRWLRTNDCPQAPLFMRETGNWQAAWKYKEIAMKKLARKYGNKILVIDDDGDGDCHAMYVRNGWRHLKV